MGSWDVFLRSDQHVHDLDYVRAAIAALHDGSARAALRALGKVHSMGWGRLFSHKAYRAVIGSMISDEMYWGDDFDQQQVYVDVHEAYPGLKEDLAALTSAWREATATL